MPIIVYGREIWISRLSRTKWTTTGIALHALRDVFPLVMETRLRRVGRYHSFLYSWTQRQKAWEVKKQCSSYIRVIRFILWFNLLAGIFFCMVNCLQVTLLVWSRITWTNRDVQSELLAKNARVNLWSTLITIDEFRVISSPWSIANRA